jgi:hypothetical protein
LQYAAAKKTPPELKILGVIPIRENRSQKETIMFTAIYGSWGRKTAVLGLGLFLFLIQNSCAGNADGAGVASARATDAPARNDYAGKLSGFERVTALTLDERQDLVYPGRENAARTALEREYGLVFTNERGGALIVPGQKAAAANPDLADARELKLKMRELAAQLVANLPSSFSSYIAIPVSFVAQDDFESSSSLGRFAVEQMLYEFNQRGLSTRELRMNGKLTMREDGEFILSRQNSVTALDARALYLAGTYHTGQNTVFINARLIRANGQIIRTGQIIMPLNPLTRRMLAASGKKIAEQYIEILDFEQEARPLQSPTAFDQGMDIH